MSRPSTCLPCRARKVKCDGGVPHCNRCIRTNRSQSCTYDLPLNQKQKVSALQKGEACIPCRTKKKRCDATRPICQRCAVARYHDQCIYDASTPDPPIEFSASQTRRIMARRTSLTGDTPRQCLSSASDTSQDSPPPGRSSSQVLATPPQPSFPSDNETVPHGHLQRVQATAPFSSVQPLQKWAHDSQPRTSSSHYRTPRTYYDKNHPSKPSEGEDNPETSVVIRSSALVPSSPLLKSTVSNPPAPEPHQIQADPASPYYTFRDTRLIPNPIVRIFMENTMNPKMFSLQSISPDTLSLLFRIEFVSHLIQFAQFLPVAKLQAIILGDTSGTFVHPCVVHLANLMGCHLHQDNRLDYNLNHLELLHLNTVCRTLEEMDRSSQQHFQPRFYIPGQTHNPTQEASGSRMPGEDEDPFAFAQIRFLLFLYALLWRCTNVASRLLRSVFYIVERNDLRFVPEYRHTQVQHGHEGHAALGGDPNGSQVPIPEFSESDYERVVFLSSLIGADAGLQLFGLARRTELSWLDLERQFFDELPAAYPTLSQMPLVWRDRGLLLLNHAMGLQKQHKDGKDVIQSCKDLIGSHFVSIGNLPNVIALHKDDHEGHLVLRCAAIVANTAMAVLLRTLSWALEVGQGGGAVPALDQAPPRVYRRRCRKSLKEAIKITRGLADTDYPFIDVVMAVCWFQIRTITAELDAEDITMGISPERESPPPAIPPASKSPTIRSAEPVTRADQIRQQQAQYQREREQRQQSPPTPQLPVSSSISASASFSGSSRASSISPPHQATISEIYEGQSEMTETMPSIDEVAMELSDSDMLDKCTKQLQASFWRPIPDDLTNRMHRTLEGLKVVMENQEGVYYT